MPRSPSDEIVQGYIEEVRTYIPSLTRGLESLKLSLDTEQNSGVNMSQGDRSEAIEEAHRLAHTIKGASAMVGMYGLSHIACHMEDALEDVLSGKLTFTDEAFQVMTRTVGHFQTYCADYLDKGVDARDMLEETILGFRRMRGLPQEQDAESLEKLLKIVPKHEGPPAPAPPSPAPAQFSGMGTVSGMGMDGRMQEPRKEPSDGTCQGKEELLAILRSLPDAGADEEEEEAWPETSEVGQEGATDTEDLMGLLDSISAGDGEGGVSAAPDADEAEDLMGLLEAATEDEEDPGDAEGLMDLLESVSKGEMEGEDGLPSADAPEDLMALLDSVSEGGTDGEDDLPEGIPQDVEDLKPSKPPALNIPPELLEGFHEEAKDHLQSLGRSVNTLEAEITGPLTISPGHREIILEIHRSVHTLKGASAVMGLPNLSAFAHSTEDLLDWLCETAEEISPEIVTALADATALLETLMAQPEIPQSKRADALRDQYRRIMKGAGPGPRTRERTKDAGQRATSVPETHADPPSPTPVPEDVGETGDQVAEALSPEPASDLPPELLESFYEEAEEHLQDMGRSIGILETDIIEPGTMSRDEKEIIRQIRRSVHTLKGASAVIGLPNISTFAHSAEDLLDWLYETAGEINPDIISVLSDTAFLLQGLVERPQDPQTTKAEALKAEYQKIMGLSPASLVREPASELKPPGPDGDRHRGTVEELPSSPNAAKKNDRDTHTAVFQTKTLRVGMKRVDDLVNLVGELIIASSAYDQKMDVLMAVINELELSRDRIRDVARDMEVGFEVKALDQLQDSEFKSDKTESDFKDFDTLELDRYSRLNLIIRTLNESVIDVGAINTNLANLHSDLDGHLNRQRVILSELQDKMMRIRMTPMATITNKLRQTIRDVSIRLGKKIRLVMEGEDIELDRVIWEKITDPLMHILRNAADHGIEPPELRQALGKPPVATVKLAASREGNQVVIRVSDDGAGINYPAIRATARKAGILADRLDEMSEEELASLIFQPGFSTRGKISEVSGRGVGMDVVRENIQDVKGTVRLISWEGKGARFTIRIPLTLAVMRGLLFTVGGRMFAIALNEIKEILRIDPENITDQIEDVVKIGPEILPLYHLTELLSADDQSRESTVSGKESRGQASASANPLVLVAEAGGKRGVLAIDSLVGQREIVIKSTGSHLRYVRGISGATIMGDGSVVPILNVEELLRTEMIAAETEASIDQQLMDENPLEIMVVDDSVSIRQVVSRLMADQGWKTHTAKDGIDALEKLRDIRPDLIVLDIEMPRMNGYEFLSAARAEPAYRDIPVVMLTSRTTAKHRQKAITLGARGFIVKPYNDEEFINLVLKLTEK